MGYDIYNIRVVPFWNIGILTKLIYTIHEFHGQILDAKTEKSIFDRLLYYLAYCKLYICYLIRFTCNHQFNINPYKNKGKKRSL